MLIREKTLQHWVDHFYGYGSWRADFWFVAFEDGGGNTPEEVAEKLNYFYREHADARDGTLCDLRDLYRNSSPSAGAIPGAHSENSDASPTDTEAFNLYAHRFGSDARLNGVWKNLTAFVHGYRNQPLPDLLDYQKTNFASPSGQEALLRLYPLPSPHNHAWYYSWLDMPAFPYLKSRTLYLEHLYDRRLRTILENITTYRPEVVLMYGMNNINTLKKSVQAFFAASKFTMVKATPRQIPQHHLAEINGTKLLITTQIPALRHNRIETGFDWEQFGRMVGNGPMG